MTNERATARQTDKQGSAELPAPPAKNLRRVAAGRLNRRKRMGLTEDGRRRLRENAFKHRPWQHSTGPLSEDGKAKVAENGRYRQRGDKSKRAIKKEIQQALATTDRLTELTQLLDESGRTQVTE